MQEDVDELGLNTAYEASEEIDPSTFEAKAASILHGLGFSQEMMARTTMSGSWRMRVALARYVSGLA